MSAESSNQSGGWGCAKDALAEIRACGCELETFVSNAFDRLESLTDELLAQELTRQGTYRQDEQNALKEQIDHLASVTAELAKSVTEQKLLAGLCNNQVQKN